MKNLKPKTREKLQNQIERRLQNQVWFRIRSQLWDQVLHHVSTLTSDEIKEDSQLPRRLAPRLVTHRE